MGGGVRGMKSGGNEDGNEDEVADGKGQGITQEHEQGRLGQDCRKSHVAGLQAHGGKGATAQHGLKHFKMLGIIHVIVELEPTHA
jgi:hypothetical protein